MSRSSSIYTSNLLSLCTNSKKNELLSALNELHKSLNKLSQDLQDRPKELSSLSLQFIAPKILNHSDKEVRLITCCCIVDILRIFAPEAPYSDNDMVRVFEVLISQIGGISTHEATSSSSRKIIYILSSIATVKSCVVPVILSQSGVKGAEELVVSLFHCLISSVRPEHSDEIISYCCSILISCVEEFEDFSAYQEVLENLLLPLLPQCKADNGAAYRLCGTVLRKVSAIIQIPLSAFINKILLESGGGDEEGNVALTELEQHVYVMIFELHKISPALLSRIIPTICQQMVMETESLRMSAVKLMSKLFSSPHAEYVQDFSRGFREFLARSRDKSTAVRLEVADCCATILKKRANYLKIIEEPFVSLLRDGDWEVRLFVLEKLIEFTLASPLSLSDHSLQEVQDRVTDKRVEVRRTALNGLAKWYNRFIVSSLPPLWEVYSEDDGGLVSNLDEDMLNRFQFIPGVIIKSWGVPDISSKHLVLQIFQEWILPKNMQPKVDDKSAAVEHNSGGRRTGSATTEGKHDDVARLSGIRASALLLFFLLLESADRDALALILTFKAKVRKEVKSFLDIRASFTAHKRAKSGGGLGFLTGGRSSTGAEDAANNDEQEWINNLRRPFYNLMHLLPVTDKKSALFDKLHNAKDKAIFGLLAKCVTSTTDISESLKAREELTRKLDSKSALSEYLYLVFDFASFSIDNAAVVSSLADNLCKQNPILGRDAQELSSLLQKIAKFSSESFSQAIGSVRKWLNSSIDFDGKSKQHRLLQRNQIQGSISALRDIAVAGAMTAQSGTADSTVAEVIDDIVRHLRTVPDVQMCANLAEILPLLAYHRNASFAAAEDDTDGDNVREKAVEAMVELMTHLASTSSKKKSLSLSNSRLECDLAIMAALSQFPLKILDSRSFCYKSFKECMACGGEMRAIAMRFITDEVFNGHNFSSGLCSSSIVVAGLKTMTMFISFEEEHKQMQVKLNTIPEYSTVFGTAAEHEKSSQSQSDSSEFTSSSSSTTVSVEFVKLVKLLFDCIESDGENLSVIQLPLGRNSSDKDMFLLAACCCAMSLVKLKVFTTIISVEQWHRLGWTLLLPSASMRAEVWAVLCSLLKLYPLHPKFLAYPCVLAGDELLSGPAERFLQLATQRLRSTHEDICASLIKKENEHLRKVADQTIPESVLPYVLHLISYHPDLPTSPECSSESDSKALKVVLRGIRLVLLALQSSLRNEASNIPYLLKQVHLISQLYCDRIDPENIGLQFVASLTRNIIQENVKTAENMQVYPGNISLPPQLFQLKAEPDESGTTAQLMVDRAIAAAHKPGKHPKGGKPTIGKIFSPVRRTNVTSKASPGTASSSSSRADSKHSDKSPKPKPKPRATAKSKLNAADSKPQLLEEDQKGTPGPDNKQGELVTVGRSKPPSKRSSKAAASRPSPVPEEKTRSLPARRAKAAVSTYKEADVSEKEVHSWDETAGEVKKSAHKRSTDSRPSAGGDRSSFGEEDDEEKLEVVKRRAVDESFNSTKRVSSYNIKDIVLLEPEISSPKLTVSSTAQKTKTKEKDRDREREKPHTTTVDANKRRDSELDLAAEEQEEFVAISSRLPRESAEWDSMLEARGSADRGRGSAGSSHKKGQVVPVPRISAISKNIAIEALSEDEQEDEPVVSLSKRRKFGLQVAENNAIHSHKPSSDDSYPVVGSAAGAAAQKRKATPSAPHSTTNSTAVKGKNKATAKSASVKSPLEDKSAAVEIDPISSVTAGNTRKRRPPR